MFESLSPQPSCISLNPLENKRLIKYVNLSKLNRLSLPKQTLTIYTYELI